MSHATIHSMDVGKAKRAVAEKASFLVESGMIVGLGSGTTASVFIECLALRCQNENLSIQTVASSIQSANLAKKQGLIVLDLNQVGRVDLTVDGADEIDRSFRMIKGGGGAHVREKILATASDRMVAIVDETKIVARLGKNKLPVEVLFYGAPATRQKIEKMGFSGQFRHRPDGSFFITENGNLLFDILFPSPPESPEEVEQRLLAIPGVVDTGFFFGIASQCFIGMQDGSVNDMKALSS